MAGVDGNVPEDEKQLAEVNVEVASSPVGLSGRTLSWKNVRSRINSAAAVLADEEVQLHDLDEVHRLKNSRRYCVLDIVPHGRA